MRARGRTLPPDATTGGRIIGLVQVAAFVRDAASPWAEPGMWHWLLADNPVPAVPDRLPRALRQFDPPAGLADVVLGGGGAPGRPEIIPNAHAEVATRRLVERN
jgi:hypothetical protein